MGENGELRKRACELCTHTLGDVAVVVDGVPSQQGDRVNDLSTKREKKGCIAGTHLGLALSQEGPLE